MTKEMLGHVSQQMRNGQESLHKSRESVNGGGFLVEQVDIESLRQKFPAVLVPDTKLPRDKKQHPGILQKFLDAYSSEFPDISEPVQVIDKARSNYMNKEIAEKCGLDPALVTRLAKSLGAQRLQRGGDKRKYK